MPEVGFVDRPVAVSLLKVQRETSALSRRVLLLALVALAALAGLLITSPAAASQAVALFGPDLTRLLRGMAGIKATAAIMLVAVTYWRLASTISPAKFAIYALACAAMAAGPGLMWDMAHLKVGALLLHGGLFVDAVVLWRDPDLATRLQTEIARRRARLRS